MTTATGQWIWLHISHISMVLRYLQLQRSEVSSGSRVLPTDSALIAAFLLTPLQLESCLGNYTDL